MKNKHLLPLLIAAAASSCANLSSLQTARVQKEGESQMALGAGYVSFPALSGATTTGAAPGLPYFEGMVRRGFFKNFDAGVKLTLVGTAAVDAKYQLLDLGGFALAVGAGGGFLSFSSGSATALLLDFVVPLYLSYDFNEWFALYASPKFVYRLITASGSGTASVGAPIGGGTAGFKVGTRWGFMGEASYGAGLTASYGSTLQFNGAFFFKI